MNDRQKQACFENPLSKIGKSTFASLRAKRVVVFQMTYNVCGCKYHSNMLLVLEFLHRRTDVPQHLDEFIDFCDKTSPL